MAIGQYLGGGNSSFVNNLLNTDNSPNNTFKASSVGAGTGSNNMMGIRNYLTGQGYNNNDIGYNNGNVTLQGHNFLQATPQAQDDLQNGMYKDNTYASPTALQGALGAYHNTFGNPSTDMTSKTGRTNALGNALNGQVSALNSQPFQFKQQQPAFSYDPNSDQAYQAALKSAQFNIQQGQGNTLANLAAHGQGNSSYAATAAQQIANQGMNNVSQNILPQLIQQAYQRYQDQNKNDYQNQMANYGVGQDQFKNQSALAGQLNGLNQQDFTNNIATNQDTRAGQAQDATFTGQYNDPHTTAIQRQMAANSAAYGSASPEEQARLHEQNMSLAKSIGGVDTTGNGDYSFGPGTKTLGGRQTDIAQQNADSMEKERIAIGKWRESQAAHQNAIANGQIGVARQGNSIAQKKLDQESQARDVESEVYGHSNEFQTEQDVNDYFKANNAYLVKNLGIKSVEDMKKSFLSPFNADNKQGNSDFSKALSMAQKDPRWLMDGNDKKALIKEYQGYMN